MADRDFPGGAAVTGPRDPPRSPGTVRNGTSSDGWTQYVYHLSEGGLRLKLIISWVFWIVLRCVRIASSVIPLK